MKNDINENKALSQTSVSGIPRKTKYYETFTKN